ncbi:MAG: hypothetical protein RR365_02310, partial [Bacteroides sp.]
ISENTKANADSTKEKDYITEIAAAVSDAVAAISQTFVDALKKNGEFTVEAHKEAAEKALVACLASISPAAKVFLEHLYGDINVYLANKIEAEVRKQKSLPANTVPVVIESTAPDMAAIAASTAAATAATIAVQQINQK